MRAPPRLPRWTRLAFLFVFFHFFPPENNASPNNKLVCSFGGHPESTGTERDLVRVATFNIINGLSLIWATLRHNRGSRLDGWAETK
jgi:hypothetical protein